MTRIRADKYERGQLAHPRLSATSAAKFLFFGCGRLPLWEKKYGTLAIVESGADVKRYPRADILLKLAQPRLAKAKPDAYKRVLPLYLRDATAIERLKAGAKSKI